MRIQDFEAVNETGIDPTESNSTISKTLIRKKKILGKLTQSCLTLGYRIQLQLGEGQSDA
jgi:hypothetical protein